MEARIEQDPLARNSRNPWMDNPDDQALLDKHIQLWLWELLAVKPLR